MTAQWTDRQMIEMLSASAQQFLKSLAARAVVPQFLSAITSDGKNVLVPLDALTLDRGSELNFYRWLCKHERFLAYAFISHVAIADDDAGELIRRAGQIMVYTPYSGREITMKYVPVRTQGIVYGEPEIFDLDQAAAQSSLFYFFGGSRGNFLEGWKFAGLWRRLAKKSDWRAI